ncbi:MAG TPA: hypothetical protein VHD55_01665 [Candidatus Paceibacterota bacterium]|nr:hypothetical protein [Candidatus Paceibacterota bacterium]
MENVHFLNIEYILLRGFDIVNAVFAFFGFPLDGSATPADQAATASHVASGFSFSLGLIAVIGMVATVFLFALAVWVRIRLVTVEHEGFHGKEAHEHKVEHPEDPHKNPHWEKIREWSSSGSESDWRRAILEADIMLGDLLNTQGYRGKDIGEKLRDANPLQFSTLDLAWKAHKVRNDIAHQGETYHLSQREANATIDLYRRVFEEFDFV